MAVMKPFYVAKTFEARSDAERWAKKFDYGRQVCGMKPLSVIEKDGEVRVLRDDTRRFPVRP